MKFIFLLMLMFSFCAHASFKYKIVIDDKGYDLVIRMEFHNKASLQKIRLALTSGKVLSDLSPNIDTIEKNSLASDKYESIMTVSSFGLSSKLPSLCEEKWDVNSWERKCTLLTDKLDGGKYMEWKTDQVICKTSDPAINCEFLIKGKAKPLTILGLSLLDHKQFAVKAKVQALHNFFKQYIYIKEYNLSLKRTLSQYDASLYSIAVEDFATKAKEALKTNTSYIEEKYFEN